MDEIWRDIEGYKGYYKVSNMGNFKSLDREIVTKKCKRKIKGKILGFGYVFGYRHVWLSKKNKVIAYRAHRIVAQTFIPNAENKPQVNHIDCNRINNYVNNLEWCTARENTNHSIKFGKGKYNGARSVIMLDNDGNILKIFYSIKKASESLGYNEKTFYNIVLGYGKNTTGFKWEYLDNLDKLINKYK